MSEPKTAEVKVVPVESWNRIVGALKAARARGWTPGAAVCMVADALRIAEAVPASPPAEKGEGSYGFLFEDDDGTEWKLEDPRVTGENEYATNVRPATAKEAVKQMLAAWEVMAEDAAQPVSPSEGEPDAWLYHYHGLAFLALPNEPRPHGAEALYKARPASDQSDTERMRAWGWLAENTDLELDYGSSTGEPEDPLFWRVHQTSGGVNDREWDLIATGATPLEAVTKARAALGEA